MRKTSTTALCGIIAAMSTVIMLLAYFPYLTYGLPAIAGGLLIILIAETGKKYAFMVFAVVGILSFFVCEKEAALCYILFFGYYPILKMLVEKLPYKSIKWVLKLLIFNITFASIYIVSTFVMGIDAEMLGDFGKYTLFVLFVTGNIMFVVYDYALDLIFKQYILKFSDKIHRILK